MTIQVVDVFTEVRRILQDETATKRHSDADLRSAMRNALATMRRLRPDLFTADMTALPNMSQPTLPIEDQFISPLSFLLSGIMLMSNDEFSQDGTARNLIRLGTAQLVRPA